MSPPSVGICLSAKWNEIEQKKQPNCRVDVLCQRGAGRAPRTFSPTHGLPRRTLPRCERTWPAGSSGRWCVSSQPWANWNTGQTTVNSRQHGHLYSGDASPRGLAASRVAKPPEKNVLAGFAGASRGPRFPQKLINQLGAPEPSGAVPQGRNKVRAAQHVHVANILTHQGWAAPFYSTFFLIDFPLWIWLCLKKKKKKVYRTANAESKN